MSVVRSVSAFLTSAILLTGFAAAFDTPNPAMEKFQADMKTAVLNGSITIPQVKQLQDSLNELQDIKGKQERPLQAIRALQGSKSQIETVMNTGSFRPQDRQAVLDDLNSLGPQGGGMHR